MKGNEMLIALCARGAHPDIVGTHDIYAPLNGSWDVEVFDLEGDGARRVSSGEWHFAWVLEGRAMQDVLIAPTRDERRNGISIKGNRCATTLRIFDYLQAGCGVCFSLSDQPELRHLHCDE